MPELAYSLIKEIAVLRAGRTPVVEPQGWVWQGAGASPKALAEGVEVDGALVAWAGVRLRRDAVLHQAWLRIDQVDPAQFYGPTFLAPLHQRSAVLVAGGASIVTTRDALIAALEADPDFDGTVGAVENQDGVVALSSATPWRYRLDGVTSGANTQALAPYQSLALEASRCVWRVWGLPRNLDRWVPLTAPRLSYEAAEVLKLDVAGLRRIYVEVLEADGEVLALAGPCLLEGHEDIAVEQAANSMESMEELLYSFPTSRRGDLAQELLGDNGSPVDEQPSSSMGAFYTCQEMERAQVSIYPTDNVDTYTVRVVTHDGYDRAQVQDALYENLTGPFTQTFHVQGVRAIQALVQDVVAVDAGLEHRLERRWTGTPGEGRR